MRGIMNLQALLVSVSLCSPVFAEETPASATKQVSGKTFDVKKEEMRSEAEVNMRPVTFYCCDRTGKVICTVNAPGPVGEPCFCPGVVPAGTLCMPHQ